MKKKSSEKLYHIQRVSFFWSDVIAITTGDTGGELIRIHLYMKNREPPIQIYILREDLPKLHTDWELARNSGGPDGQEGAD